MEHKAFCMAIEVVCVSDDKRLQLYDIELCVAYLNISYHVIWILNKAVCSNHGYSFGH